MISSGPTALAVAAEPTLGRAGYWLMTVTGLFATTGATNAGLYPASGLCEHMVGQSQFPPLLGRRFGGRAPAGLLLTAAIAIVLAAFFDLSSIASIGSAIALMVFTLVSVAHVRARERDRCQPRHAADRHRLDGGGPRRLRADHAGRRARDSGRDRRDHRPERPRRRDQEVVGRQRAMRRPTTVEASTRSVPASTPTATAKIETTVAASCTGSGVAMVGPRSAADTTTAG